MSPMTVLPPNSFLLRGMAYVILNDGSFGIVEYEISSSRNSKKCKGAVAAPPAFIDLMVAEKDVVLLFSEMKGIPIKLDGPSVLDGRASFSCDNPLFVSGTGRVEPGRDKRKPAH